MKAQVLLIALVIAAVLSGRLVGDGGNGTAAGERPGDGKEVTGNPALLISPTLNAGELSVYGVGLGGSPDKISHDAGVTPTGVPERPQDTIYVGRNVRYYACDGRIYRINVSGDITKKLPSYDAFRLQAAMGKADDIEASTENTRLSFFSRHVRYMVHAYRDLSVVSEVDIYAP